MCGFSGKALRFLSEWHQICIPFSRLLGLMSCALNSWLCFGTWAWRTDLAPSLPTTPPSMGSHFLRACQESGREEMMPRLGVKSVCLSTFCRMVTLNMSQLSMVVSTFLFSPLPSSTGTWLRHDSDLCGSLEPCGWPSDFTMVLLFDTVPLGLWKFVPLGSSYSCLFPIVF